MSSATLVSSWAASVRATAACDRSWTTIRNPSPIAIKLKMTSRWLRAVSSTDRLRIFHQEGGVVRRDTEPRAPQPGKAQPVNPVAALQLGELIRVADAIGQRRRIADRNHGVRSAQSAGIVDQDVDAGVVEGRTGHDPLPVDGDRLRPARPQDIDDVLQVLVMDGPAERMIHRTVRVRPVVQQHGQTRPVQRGQASKSLLLIELGFDFLGCTRSAGALILTRLDIRLQGLDASLERAVLVLQLVDTLAQGFITGEPVGGRQRLASELGGGEPRDEESRKRNACQDSYPRRHGAV